MGKSWIISGILAAMTFIIMIHGLFTDSLLQLMAGFMGLVVIMIFAPLISD